MHRTGGKNKAAVRRHTVRHSTRTIINNNQVVQFLLVCEVFFSFCVGQFNIHAIQLRWARDGTEQVKKWKNVIHEGFRSGDARFYRIKMTQDKREAAQKKLWMAQQQWLWTSLSLRLILEFSLSVSFQSLVTYSRYDRQPSRLSLLTDTFFNRTQICMQWIRNSGGKLIATANRKALNFFLLEFREIADAMRILFISSVVVTLLICKFSANCATNKLILCWKETDEEGRFPFVDKSEITNKNLEMTWKIRNSPKNQKKSIIK